MRSASLTLIAAAVAASLTACGGGSTSDSTAASATSADTTSADSASATEAPTEAATVMEASVQTTQALVATSTAGTAIACPGGGTASYSVSSGTDDGLLQAGEVYQVTFDACKGAAGALAVTGSATYTMQSVTTNALTANVTFTDLHAALPLATVTVNGTASVGASLVYTRGSGPTLTAQTTHTASGLSLTRATASRTTSYSVDALSLTRNTQLASDGSVTSTGVTGSATLSTTRLSGTYSATLSFQSAVSFAGGLPTSGSWTVTLPNSILAVTATPSLITVTLDQGKDGSIDRTRTYVPGTWAGSVD